MATAKSSSLNMSGIRHKRDMLKAAFAAGQPALAKTTSDPLAAEARRSSGHDRRKTQNFVCISVFFTTPAATLCFIKNV